MGLRVLHSFSGGEISPFLRSFYFFFSHFAIFSKILIRCPGSNPIYFLVTLCLPHSYQHACILPDLWWNAWAGSSAAAAAGRSPRRSARSRRDSASDEPQ